jgi:hypothetical protein
VVSASTAGVARPIVGSVSSLFRPNVAAFTFD